MATFTMDYKTGKLVPLVDGRILPVGQVVSYENQASPLTEFVIVSEEPGDYGQRAVALDGSHEADFSVAVIEGPGGHKVVEGKLLDAEEIAEVLAKREANRKANAAKRKADDQDREERQEIAQQWFDANKPEWAKAVLIASLKEDQSDSMTDYFASSTTRTVLLAWSKHTRDLFPEMRKAAAKFGETAHLADAPKEAEHREKYSMGGGYYLSDTGRHGSGWKVSKAGLSYLTNGYILAAANPEDRAPIEATAAPERKAAATSASFTGSATIEKHYHTKREIDFWLVVLADKVDRETFEALRSRAKDAGGWYSRKWGRVPGGFAFEAESAAHAFADSLGEDPPAGGSDGSDEPTPLDPSVADKLRDLADRMDKSIEDKLRPMTQNWTPKRGVQYASRLHDGHDLQRAQAALRALADARDAGMLPEVLVGVRTKRQVLDMTQTRVDTSGGHYSMVETDEPVDTSTAAVALRELVDSGKSDADREAELAAKRDREIQTKIDDLRGAKDGGFFPTPDPVIDRMLDAAEIEVGHRILEPSAGIGSILDKIVERLPGAIGKIDANERYLSLAEILEMKGYATMREDFLGVAPEAKYDRIVMNPPFDKGADVKHVRHAYQFLKPGGRLVALMGNGAAFAKAGDWLGDVDADIERLPSGSFDTIDAFHRTGVEVNLIVIDKPEEIEVDDTDHFVDRTKMVYEEAAEELDYLAWI